MDKFIEMIRNWLPWLRKKEVEEPVIAEPFPTALTEVMPTSLETLFDKDRTDFAVIHDVCSRIISCVSRNLKPDVSVDYHVPEQYAFIVHEDNLVTLRQAFRNKGYSAVVIHDEDLYEGYLLKITHTGL